MERNFKHVENKINETNLGQKLVGDFLSMKQGISQKLHSSSISRHITIKNLQKHMQLDCMLYIVYGINVIEI